MPAIGADSELFAGSAGPPLVAGAGGVRAKFYVDSVHDKKASAEQGRPIYKDVEFVELQVIGDRTSLVQRPAEDKDRKRFPQEYALFKQGDAEQLTGTPLKQWPVLSKSQALELEYFNIRTVEQLAALSDGNAALVGPILKLRGQAKDYLDQARGLAPATKLREELAAKDKRIASLEARLAALEEAATKPNPKK